MADRARYAPEGATWVCGGCGRHGKDRYALGDTSCVTWAVLCQESSLVVENGLVTRADAFKEEK